LTYESVTVQTLSLDVDFGVLVPYVTVSENGRITDSTKHSLGEFWVHQVFWELDQLAPVCLFLLDESESIRRHLTVPMGTIEVVSAGGKNAVIAGVRALVNAQRIRYFGVLDADYKESDEKRTKSPHSAR
jgi:hypothetical protein